MPSREVVLAAANKLEDLSIELKDIVRELRAGTGDPYKMTYDFRTEVGRVVAVLGYGVPKR